MYRLRHVVWGVTVALLGVGAVAMPAQAQTASTTLPGAIPITEFCDGVPPAPFPDITAESSFTAEIACAAFVGVAQGLRDGSYGAGRTVTRAQMASFVVRTMDAADALELDEDAIEALPATGTSTFTDVTGVHRANIERLAGVGIVRGGPGGAPATIYGPDLPVSRSQMASFINRALDYLAGSVEDCPTGYFTDVDGNTAVPADARCDIGVLAAEGIVEGIGDGRYNPGGVVNRGQMAAFLTRTLAVLHNYGLIGEAAPVDGDDGNGDDGDGDDGDDGNGDDGDGDDGDDGDGDDGNGDDGDGDDGDGDDGDDGNGDDGNGGGVPFPATAVEGRVIAGPIALFRSDDPTCRPMWIEGTVAGEVPADLVIRGCTEVIPNGPPGGFEGTFALTRGGVRELSGTVTGNEPSPGPFVLTLSPEGEDWTIPFDACGLTSAPGVRPLVEGVLGAEHPWTVEEPHCTPHYETMVSGELAGSWRVQRHGGPDEYRRCPTPGEFVDDDTPWPVEVTLEGSFTVARLGEPSELFIGACTLAMDDEVSGEFHLEWESGAILTGRVVDTDRALSPKFDTDLIILEADEGTGRLASLEGKQIYLTLADVDSPMHWPRTHQGTVSFVAGR
jgi:hypothetical protein